MKLVFDGGCPFCRHFAELSELRSGIPDFEIVDGREDHQLRHTLADCGYPLASGAVLIDGDHVFHGSQALHQLCDRFQPSSPLLALLKGIFADPDRTRQVYPLLLMARHLALGLKGLPVDPEASRASQ